MMRLSFWVISALAPVITAALYAARGDRWPFALGGVVFMSIPLLIGVAYRAHQWWDEHPSRNVRKK